MLGAFTKSITRAGCRFLAILLPTLVRAGLNLPVLAAQRHLTIIASPRPFIFLFDVWKRKGDDADFRGCRLTCDYSSRGFP